MFLAKDLKEFKSSSPSFIQLNARSSEDSQESADEPVVPAQPVAVESDSMSGTVMLQQGTEAGTSSGDGIEEEAAGPFDNVISMIKDLMQNIRDQANKDTNLNQWCLESAAEAEGSRIKIKQERNEI